MRPFDYPINLEELASCWQAHMSQNPVDDRDGFDPVVIESWNRCLLRYDPTKAPQIIKAKESQFQVQINQQSSWLTVAVPYLEDMREHMAGSKQTLLLTDHTGCLLSVQKQIASYTHQEQPKYELGTYWLEPQMGTNALGLALITAMPTQVVGPEHFFQVYHDTVSTAAPIHDEEGQLIGIVGMVGPVETADSLDLAFVTATAHAIGNLLQSNQFLEESNQQLTQVNAILGTISEGVLMWDNLGRINHCNPQAAKMFGVDITLLSGKFVDEVISFQPQIRLAIEQKQAVKNIETVVQIDNRRISCLLTLMPVSIAVNQSAAWIALLQPITQVRQLVQQQIGTQAIFTINDFVSHSASMKKIIQQAQSAAKANAPVLLYGEGGVGKKRLAQAIHNSGPRAKKPFVIFNCRATPQELMMSELLGVEESHAQISGRPSKFELADGGTLVIESIEDLPLELQEVLLNLIDMRYFIRVGGSRMIPVNVRIIVTSMTDLHNRVVEKSFAAQLYHRLSVFRFSILPLRKRPEDISGIIQRFLTLRSHVAEKAIEIAPSAMEVLKHYPWPGNVRELENVLERAFSHSADGVLQLSDLPESVRMGRVIVSEDPEPMPVISLKEAEKEAIMRAGWACHGVVSKMAEELDIGRTTLWRKMRELDIQPEQFK